MSLLLFLGNRPRYAASFATRCGGRLVLLSPPVAEKRTLMRTIHRSTAPWLEEMPSPAETTQKLKDQSAAALSRAPFSMPRNSQDDSVPNEKGGFISWSKMGLLSELVEGVFEAQNLEAPTPVQKLVIPELLKAPYRNVAFLAATGSGKTLAYTLPLLQILKSQELFHSYERRMKRPRLLILAPTRELAAQISVEVKKLCHHVKLSCQGIVGGQDYGKQRRSLNRYVDVVVASPGRLLKLWKAGDVYLGEVSHVVMDEMDTMLEQGFQHDLANLIHPLLYQTSAPKEGTPLKEGAPRIILTSATMTRAVQKLIGHDDDNLIDDTVTARRHFVKAEHVGDNERKVYLPPNMKVMKAPGLHRAVPRLRQVFVDTGNIDKLSLLSDVVHQHGGRGAATRSGEGDEKQLTLVFCNTVASCRAAQHALTEAGMESLGYHGDLNSAARAQNLERFRQAGFGNDEGANILVATDLAARGLDVPQVDHVVMFDFPLNPLDYLHRSGRTARGVGGGRTGNGRVTALVSRRDKVLATAIERAVQRGEPLDGLSSRKSDYLPGARLNKLVGGDAPRANFRTSRKSSFTDNPRNRRGGRSRNSGGRRGSKPNQRRGRGRP